MAERFPTVTVLKNEPDALIAAESDYNDQSSESAESDHDVSDQNNTNDEEDDRAEVNKHEEKMIFICEAFGDFVAEETDDLSFEKGDILTIISMRADGWWEAEDQNGRRGMVPSSFLKVPDKIQRYMDDFPGTVTASMGHGSGQTWDKLRSSVKQSLYIDQSITAMGALPVGFCHSSLKQLINEDSAYSTEAFLAPKLNDSGLSFQDFHLSSNTKSLMPITTRLQRGIRLVAFRQVCSPSAGYEISSRHVHICLHDGSKVLSNIITLRAKFDPKIPKIWTFSRKIPTNGSSLEEGQFFIRSNATSPTIGILFQLCLSFTKIATNDIGEMSCGWVFMRLLDDSGQSVPNRTTVLKIHSGVPFMSQNGSPSALGNKSGSLQLFINRAKNPRVVVSLTSLKQKYDQLMNFLPTTIIGTASSIPLLALYRKILADKLLKARISFDSTDFISSPFLATFPKAFAQLDVVDAFGKCWSDHSQRIKQSISKNEDLKKMAFQQIFMETAFLILHSNILPNYVLGNMQVEKERKIGILRIMQLIKDKGPLSVSMSPEYRFYPMTVRDSSLDIIGKHCLSLDDNQ